MRVVCFSGGLDSTVLLHASTLETETVALSVDYGQRHALRELRAAREALGLINS